MADTALSRSKVMAADSSLPPALRWACLAFVVNVGINAIEIVANPSAFSHVGVFVGTVVDLLIALSIWRYANAREPARRLAIVRVVLGLLYFGGAALMGGNRVGALIQLTLSSSMLLLLVSDASRARALVGLVLNVLVQAVRLVVVMGAFLGYALLAPWIEGAKYEPATAEVRGRAFDYRLRLLPGWQSMKPGEVDAVAPGVDRIVARLVRDVQLLVVPSRIRWDQRFDARAAIDAVPSQARAALDEYVELGRGTLPPPLSTPYIEYRGRPKQHPASPANQGALSPAIATIVTFVRGSMGDYYTLHAVRAAHARTEVRDECIAALEGFRVERTPLDELPASLREVLESVDGAGLRGRAVPYRIRVERGWFSRKQSVMEEGQDRALIVPFEDVVLSTSVLRVGNAIDASATARQAVNRMGVTGTPQFEALTMPDGMFGAMLRYRANVGGDPRVGVVAVFVRERDSVLALGSAPASVEAQRLPEIERMLRSFAFE